MMNYCGIKDCDIADGPGVRVSLFVSGCRNRCPGCFQKETWDFSYGRPFDRDAQEKVFSLLAPSYIRGLTVLGGEPMEPENQAALLPFLRRVKKAMPEKDAWLYTGYHLEEVATSPLLSYADIVVDGPFDEMQKDAGLAFRGSRNQRIVNLRSSTNMILDGGAS